MPRYLVFMAAITAAYLTVEIPFSAHLLDVLAGNPTSEDIQSIEKFGRLLTGIAVAIAVMGWYLARRHARDERSLACIGSKPIQILTKALPRTLMLGVASVGVTYFALDQIAAAIGEFSSGSKRKQAYEAVMARNYLATQASGEHSDNPAWKAFVSMVPTLAGRDGILSLADHAPRNLHESEAELRLGSPGDVRTKFFGTDFQRIHDAYAAYKKGAEAYLKAMRSVDERVDAAWNDYVRERARNGVRRITYGSQAAYIRGSVQGRGIPVSNNWHPDDRRGFEIAARRKIVSEIENTYRREIEMHLETVIPPGLNFDTFLSQPAVQNRIRKNAGIATAGAIIRPEMSDRDFVASVYNPMKASLARQLAKFSQAPDKEFDEYGLYEMPGIEFAQAAAIPTLAIFLSLAGALLHICKVSGYLTQIAGYAARLRVLTTGAAKWTAGTAVAATVATIMILPGNPVTGSDAYGNLVRQAGIVAPIYAGSIAIQPRFQPVGKMLAEVGAFRFISTSLPQPRLASVQVALQSAAETTIQAPSRNVPVPVPNPLKRNLASHQKLAATL